MRKRLLLFFTVGMICSTAAAQGKLFVIGGGKRPQPLINRMLTESGIKEKGYVMILPMASSEQDSSVWYAKKQFIENGISDVRSIEVSDSSAVTDRMIKDIRGAQLIYIAGGDQVKFMNVISGSMIKQALHDAFKNGSMIAGTSAGAAVMSERMITGEQLKHEAYDETFHTIEKDNIELAEGLGFITNAIIDQHFIKRSRYNRLLTALLQHPEYTGIGIDESTALLVIGSKVEVVGDSQVIVFMNTKPKGKEANSKNFMLDIYGAGDTFLIPTKSR